MCGLGTVIELAHLFDLAECLKRQLNQGSFVWLCILCSLSCKNGNSSWTTFSGWSRNLTKRRCNFSLLLPPLPPIPYPSLLLWPFPLLLYCEKAPLPAWAWEAVPDRIWGRALASMPVMAYFEPPWKAWTNGKDWGTSCGLNLFLHLPFEQCHFGIRAERIGPCRVCPPLNTPVRLTYLSIYIYLIYFFNKMST